MATRVERWCVVTGGRGFAAGHLVEMLLRSDQWWVRIADLGPAIRLDPDEEDTTVGKALRSGRAAYVSSDLRRRSQVIKAFEGAEVVFHMAAPDSSINNYQLQHSVNIEGTRNVILACLECKVKRLIYTSSPSVVFDGVRGIFNGMESMPYPEKFNDSYSETKAEGEKLVMKANGKGGLLTCCVRPSSIFGPGDKLLVPSLVSAARAGKSKYIIGDGNNMYDFTYVENVAYGHVCAERTLASGGPRADKAAGQAFFITNNEPIKFWDFISLILEGLGYERPRIKVPVSVMMPIAHLVELAYKFFSPYGMALPQLTPSRIRLLSSNRTFSCTKARVHLDYEPIVSLKDGLKRTVHSYPHLRADKQSQTSKASTALGNGYIANALLWKDKKQTLTTLLLLATFYYYFFACGYTMIAAVAKLLSLAALFLFIHGIVPPKILGIKIEKMSSSHFHLSKGNAQHLACSITSSWNFAMRILKSFCKGKDWPLYFKVISILLFINLLGSMALRHVFKLGVPIIFIAFVAYEKWEDEIDEFSSQASCIISKLKDEAVQKYSKQ